jgi:hypothetical protein
VLQIEDLGWEPLCKFLGKPVPDVPFPHMNDAASIEKTEIYVMTKLIIRWMVLLSLGGWWSESSRAPSLSRSQGNHS